MQQQHTVMDDLRAFFRGGSILKWLLIINIGVMVFIWLVMLFYWMGTGDHMEPYTVRAWGGVFSNFEYVIYRPWGILTYMFVHDPTDFGHLFFNMLLLFFMGRIFEQLLGERRLLSMYILGGLAGYLVYAISYNVFPAFELANLKGNLVGASASVLAIMVATATYAPNLEVRLFGVFPVKLWWIVVLMVILDLASIETDGNAGGHLAHLGGAAFGFFSIYMLQKRRDILEPVNRFFDKVRNLFKPKPKIRVEYRSTQRRKTTARTSAQRKWSASSKTSSKSTDDPDKMSSAEHQRRIDAILDKISKSGYDSLSKAEKEFLFKSSNRK